MKKLLIIGGGNMGFAIASGISKKNIYTRKNVIIAETNKLKVSLLKKYGYTVLNNASDAIKKWENTLDAIIIAVKPQDIKDTLTSIKKLINKRTIIISIAAGIKLKELSVLLTNTQPLSRIMPNTPCQISEGMSVLTFNKFASKKQKHIVKMIFNSLGDIIELNENTFDLVGAINGSGPAYFCYLIEALIKSGIKEGLNEKTATKLVIQTALGTMLLLKTKNIAPSLLRKTVTSPKGITEAALKIYNKMRFNDIVHKGILAAKKRSVELGK